MNLTVKIIFFMLFTTTVAFSAQEKAVVYSEYSNNSINIKSDDADNDNGIARYMGNDMVKYEDISLYCGWVVLGTG